MASSSHSFKYLRFCLHGSYKWTADLFASSRFINFGVIFSFTFNLISFYAPYFW